MCVDKHRCPVCGYQLDEPAWVGSSPSYDICACCGIEFGYEDARGKDPENREKVHAELRARWIAERSPWTGADGPPPGWNAAAQLRAAGFLESEAN